MKYIWYDTSGTEQLFHIQTDYQEMHNLSKDPAHQEELVSWRRRLIQELADRPEGFSDGTKLIAGKEPVRASEAMMALGKQRISEGFTLAFGKKKKPEENMNFTDKLIY